MTAKQAMILALRIQSESENEAAKIILTIHKDAFIEGLNKGEEIAQKTIIELTKTLSK